MIVFNADNLVQIKTGRNWVALDDGQFWVFKEKTIEVHDNEGKVRGFRKKNIQFAYNGTTAVFHPTFSNFVNK